MLKISALCGQSMIGYCLEKSVKTKQPVGVDKMIARSIDKVLRVRGLQLPRVSVRVA